MKKSILITSLGLAIVTSSYFLAYPEKLVETKSTSLIERYQPNQKQQTVIQTMLLT